MREPAYQAQVPGLEPRVACETSVRRRKTEPSREVTPHYEQNREYRDERERPSRVDFIPVGGLEASESLADPRPYAHADRLAGRRGQEAGDEKLVPDEDEREYRG